MEDNIKALIDSKGVKNYMMIFMNYYTPFFS